MKYIFLIVLTITALFAKANDGVFYASGNQLIPIQETDISITKEILKIERTTNNQFLVTVNYTFNNPKDQKELLVGFEAPSPAGDVDGTPKNGQHPYMTDFKVIFNGKPLPFQSSIVHTEEYFKNGQIQGLTEQEAKGDNFNKNEPNFFYVYHFNTKFKKGINTIKHSYRIDISAHFNTIFELHYLLTPATRWANKQIDDFTLILDLGDYYDYLIEQTFFTGFQNWTGATKILNSKKQSSFSQISKPIRVITGHNPVVFKQKNFSPKGELIIYATTDMEFLMSKSFDHTTMDIPFNVKNFIHKFEIKNEDSYKILRNLPFARRGYVFKTPLIQQYYEKQEWYTANSKYKANINLLTDTEQKWLKTLKQKHQL